MNAMWVYTKKCPKFVLRSAHRRANPYIDCWIEYRTKLQRFDVVLMPYSAGIHRWPMTVLKTDDFFAAVGEMLRRWEAP